MSGASHGGLKAIRLEVTMDRPSSNHFGSAWVVGFGVICLAVFGLVGHSGAASSAAAVPQHPVVYETKLPCCQTIVLSSFGTLLVTTPPLQVGTYLVHATANAVIGPNDGHVVCATAPTSVGGNDGIFGYAGNAVPDSGYGPNGVYGNAVIIDTWTITTQGDTIYLYCWVGNSGAGTYVSQALIAAERLGNLIED
jgi:hypothetical protein